MSDTAVLQPAPKVSLVARMADRFGVDPVKMVAALKATAFRTEKPVTDEQLMALLIVADQYKLNPFTKELFAYPDKGGIVPVVSVDGWSRIVNEHPHFDGMEVEYSPDGGACTVRMWRKDRVHPTVITEFMVECKRGTQPWNTHPLRMLRHKAFIQCARMAFGFAGIYDDDEAQRIMHGQQMDHDARAIQSRLHAALSAKPAAPVITMPTRHAEQERVAAPPAAALPPPNASPMADNPFAGKTLAAYLDEVLHASDGELAALVVDEARSVLPPDQHADLVTAYAGKFIHKD